MNGDNTFAFRLREEMPVFMPFTRLTNATLVALMGYDYEPVELDSLYGYGEYFRARWWPPRSFINVEHDCVPWPGALESLADCPEPWCAYWYSLACVRDADINHPTTSVPLGCVKVGERLIDATRGAWDDPIKWHRCDGYLTQIAREAGFRVHRHYPGIVNACSWMDPDLVRTNPRLAPYLDGEKWVPSF